jgi:hypothetical protein
VSTMLELPLLPFTPSPSLPFSLSPLAVDESEPLGDRRAQRWIWIFLALGLAARLVRYALKFPLWNDECGLSASLLDRGYVDLLGPLDYGQVAPFLFLWVQLTLVKVFGFCEYTLRLFPILCGVASLFLFRHVAGRLLKGTAFVMAVGIFAVSYPAIRYSVEAKPYGSDVLVSLVLLAFVIEWLRRGGDDRWLWGLAALTPIAVWMSYPAVFVAGAVSIVVAVELWHRGGRGSWVAWIAYNVALLGSFAVLFAISAANQCSTAMQDMQDFWADAFPPLGSPLKLLGWLVTTHTGSLLKHPFGGDNGGSTLTFLACAAAVAVLIRRRRHLALLLCLAPLGLNFIAAALHRYPYGGFVRMAMYYAPIICLLAGLGTAAAVAWFQRGRGLSTRPLHVVLGVLAMVAVGSMARDFYRPAKSYQDMRTRDFARWFWFTAQYDGEVVCLKTDLGKDFANCKRLNLFEAMYLCYQRIYSPRHARREPPQWERITAERPLRCVEYKWLNVPYDHKAQETWLANMQERFDLVARDQYYALNGNPNTDEHQLDALEVYRFIPKSPAIAPLSLGKSPRGRVN